MSLHNFSVLPQKCNFKSNLLGLTLHYVISKARLIYSQPIEQGCHHFAKIAEIAVHSVVVFHRVSHEDPATKILKIQSYTVPDNACLLITKVTPKGKISMSKLI